MIWVERNFNMKKIGAGAWLLFLSIILPLSLLAEDEVELRVARLSYTEGNVTVQRVQDREWVEGGINTPLMAGDQVYVGLEGRAELQLEDEVYLFLGPDTYLYFAFLYEGLQQVEIQQGTLVVYSGEVDYSRPLLEVKSPLFTSTLSNHSQARFDVRDRGETQIRCREGEIQVRLEGESRYTVLARQKMTVLSSDPKNYSITPDEGEDDFDRWCAGRYALYTKPVASVEFIPNPASRRVAGLRDLDEYGQWVEKAEYGRVWSPRVTRSDWAPYREGRWVWKEHYGWTWVSYEPWGWVPYHYGRWAYLEDRQWYWVPTELVTVQTVRSRPVWYPHLATFTFGDRGSDISVSIGINGPAVGWLPLGPRDPYAAWYQPQPVRVDRISRSYYFRETIVEESFNYTQVTYSDFQNLFVPNAFSLAAWDAFPAMRSQDVMALSLDTNNVKKIKFGKNAVQVLYHKGAKSEGFVPPGQSMGKKMKDNPSRKMKDLQAQGSYNPKQNSNQPKAKKQSMGAGAGRAPKDNPGQKNAAKAKGVENKQGGPKKSMKSAGGGNPGKGKASEGESQGGPKGNSKGGSKGNSQNKGNAGKKK